MPTPSRTSPSPQGVPMAALPEDREPEAEAMPNPPTEISSETDTTLVTPSIESEVPIIKEDSLHASDTHTTAATGTAAALTRKSHLADRHVDSTSNDTSMDSSSAASASPSSSPASTADQAEFTLGVLNRRGTLPTGCCYDDRMKLHMNVDWSPFPHHPEDPRRIEEIFNAFKAHGLIYAGPPTELPRILKNCPTKYMWRIPARAAREQEICTVHTPQHYDFVRSLSTKTYPELRQLSKEMDLGRTSLYVGSMSYEAAILSAGGAIETCKQVVAGRVKNAFAVIRPPGHHAEMNQPMGFCFFNNVPIAVKICQTDYPETCRKVMVLDWDVHHGNGIQNIFYDDPNVLYVSLHVYQNGEFYPGKPDSPDLPDGGMEHCGAGPGMGRNVNIAWHDQGMGDGEYMAAFQRIVMPIAQEFNPDLVVIAAGFDAADGDELGGCFVSPTCYAHMTHMLMSLAEGKVVVCLEGGYNLESISRSAVSVARTLMGEPPPKITIPPIHKEAARVLGRVQAYQAQYWNCMKHGIVNVVDDVAGLNASRLHEIVRTVQLHELQNKYRMMPLYVYRDVLSRSFANQVLVTPRVHEARRLLVIVHDPPNVVAQPDVDSKEVAPHNAWVVDEVMQYIDWAVAHDFGVMDVNVPLYVSKDGDTDSFSPGPSEREVEAQVSELACYLYDNYLQLYDGAQEVFLVGVGNGYLGLRSLLISRGVVGFVTGSLKAVKSDIDPDLSGWYRDNSRIYVSHYHACWQDEALKHKVRKRRFGAVVESPCGSLAAMMNAHAGEAKEWILERCTLADEESAQSGSTTEEDVPMS